MSLEYSIKKLHLGRSLSVVLTAVSVYFWITLHNFDLLHIFGVGMNIAGLLLWWSARLTLGKNWNTGFGKPHIKQLVTHDIYSKIRHPLYWGINLTLFGLIILHPAYWLAVPSVMLILYFFYRMKVEDKYLSEKLGEEYRDYKRKTWM